MPPKNSGKEKDLGEEDEVLQAVILADSFNKRFKPLTSGKPRVCIISRSFISLSLLRLYATRPERILFVKSLETLGSLKRFVVILF